LKIKNLVNFLFYFASNFEAQSLFFIQQKNPESQYCALTRVWRQKKLFNFSEEKTQSQHMPEKLFLVNSCKIFFQTKIIGKSFLKQNFQGMKFIHIK
jgi:hypothetical protein